MSETPKKIWVDAELDVYDYEEQGTQPYIRADIVDKLVAALKYCMRYNGYDFDEGPAEAALAHLIAAAPDLYKALAHLEPYLDAIVCYASTIEEHPPNGFILETKAALAKARGEG